MATIPPAPTPPPDPPSLEASVPAPPVAPAAPDAAPDAAATEGPVEAQAAAVPTGPDASRGDGSHLRRRASDGAPSTGQRRWRRRAQDRVDTGRALTIMIGVAGGLLLAQVTTAAAGRLRAIILLVLLSLFLSFAFEPAVQWLHQRGIRRGIGTGLVFVVMASLAGGFILSMSGLVTDQFRSLADAAPTLLTDLSEQAARLPDSVAGPAQDFLEEQAAELPDRIASAAGLLGRSAIGISTTIVGAIFALLTVTLLTFYLVADGPRLRWQLSRRLDAERQAEFLHIWELAIAKTGGYVYSRILLAIVSAGVHIVAFRALDLRYATALGVWMGLVSSIIPVVGLYIAGALPLLVAVANPGGAALGVLLVIVAYQQVENYVVQPRITKHTLALHPALAFVAVLSGAALLGPLGALLALPTTAIIAALVTTYTEEHDVVEHGLTTTHAPRPSTSR